MHIKDKVFAALLAQTEPVSGQRLAEALGVSRNAIWKAILALRAEGHEIEASTNLGYRLTQSADRLSEPAIRHFLHTESLGNCIELWDEIDSTNRLGKERASQGAAHGTLLLARTQTSGHGRFGRCFHSPEGSGIYMSLVLRPKMPAECAVMLTSCTAVAVARAIERLADVRVEIKWVNDLYIQGKKICGILCEAGMDFESGQLDYAVVGIGINVTPMVFPPELEQIATSIGNVCSEAISRNQLIAEICNCLEELYGQLETGEFMDEYRARSNVIGKQIIVYRGDEHYSASALDIDAQGGLIVETEDGVQSIRSGEVSIRWEGTK